MYALAVTNGTPLGRATYLKMAEGTVSHHKFKVGQTVNYTSGPFGAAGRDNVFKVTQLLPAEGDDFQYRIKTVDEPHERVAKESQLSREPR